MKIRFNALGLALATAGLSLTASPVIAQEAQQQQMAQPKLSEEGQKALVAAQATLQGGGDAAAVQSAFAAAEAALKTPGDRYTFGQLKLEHAIAQNDFAAQAAAIAIMEQSGVPQMTAATANKYYNSVAIDAYEGGDFKTAATLFRRTIERGAGLEDTPYNLALAEYKAGDKAKSFAVLNDYIVGRASANQTAAKKYYDRAIATGYELNAPATVPLAIDRLGAYQSAENWADVFRIMVKLEQYNDDQRVDFLRLRRAAGQMEDGADYAILANQLLLGGYPAEALAVMEEGVSSGLVDTGNSQYNQILTKARANASGDRGTLDSVSVAAAQPNFRQVIGTADAYYGYGEYADAATLYRAALNANGADANSANLRLGMALGMQGDTAGAAQALDQVDGTLANLAALWKVYFQTRG